MKTESHIRGWTMALLMAGTVLPMRAASFSAELLDTRGGETRTVPFAFQDQSYRFEMFSSGKTVIVAADGQSGVVRILFPEDKYYVEAGRDEPLGRMLNPFAFFAYYAKTHEVRAEGTETIDGVVCTKQVAFAGEQVFATAWFSEKYGFPLKVEVPIDGRTVELRNIKAGSQDPALFVLPADYRPAPRAEEPLPEWVAQVSGAPMLSLPFEKMFTEGEMVRVRPQHGRDLRLEATNSKPQGAAFTAIGFRNGRPLSNPSMNTVNLNTDDVVTMTFMEESAGADLVIRVGSGTVKIKAEFVKSPAEAGPKIASERAPEPPEPAPAPGSVAEPDLSADVDAPDAASMASRFEVIWSGPAKKDDYITVARPNQPPGAYVSSTRVREGNPLKVWAPSEPGEFEVRYIMAEGRKLLAKTPITIKPVTASVEVSGPVKVAASFEVDWGGPAAEGDYISVARSNQAPAAYVERAAVKQGNPARLRAPSEPGDYEVRYILGRGAKLLGKAPLTAEDVTASLEAPATAAAGTDLEVRWNGPGYQEDLVVVARPQQPASANVASRATRAGNPLKLRAPKDPGEYEVRYILGRGKRMLAKTSITITPAAPSSERTPVKNGR